MINRHEIPYQHWSLKVGRQAPFIDAPIPDVAGAIVFAVDDLHQSVTNIVLTRKGSVPTEPEKGVDYDGVIDKHPDVGIPLLTREIFDAIKIWEPRIVVDNVQVKMVDVARFSTQVFWRPVESVLDDLLLTEVAFNG